MSQHDTLTQALEQIAMAAEATVCNPAWIAQHARAALAKAQAQAPQAHALDRDTIIDLISPLSRNTADHDIDFAFRVLDAAQAQQPPYAWAVSGASTMFFGPTAEYDARQEAKHCGGTAEAFPLFRAAQVQQVAGVALPLFDDLDDEAIDEACAAGSIYRVDFMRAWNALRDWRPYYTTPPTQPAPVVAERVEMALRLLEDPTPEMLESFQRGFMQQLKRRKHYKKGWEISAEQAGIKAMLETVLALVDAATPTPPAQAAQQGEKA